MILKKLRGGHALTCIKTVAVKGLEGNMATLKNAICFLNLNSSYPPGTLWVGPAAFLSWCISCLGTEHLSKEEAISKNNQCKEERACTALGRKRRFSRTIYDTQHGLGIICLPLSPVSCWYHTSPCVQHSSHSGL